MRRALSILFIALFGFAPFAALARGSESLRLPVCCRRSGVHHCASMGEMPEDAAARIAAAVSGRTDTVGAPSRCPLYPGALHATLTPAFAPAPHAAVPDAPQISERVDVFSNSHVDSSSSSAHAVRGPPEAALA